eukprot:Rmarinus@m.28707
MTIVWKYDSTNDSLVDPVQLLQGGEVIAFPTETVYGLGANAFLDNAVKKIYELKGRPSDNPLIVHIGSLDQLDNLVDNVPQVARKLMEKFWPGPLTLVLEKRKDAPVPLSNIVTAGLPTVGIRMPSHPAALELLRRARVPVAAPSANLSGKPSPTTAAHVLDDLQGRLYGIVDAGPTGVGVESTIVDCSNTSDGVLYVLRPGGLPVETLAEVAGVTMKIVHPSEPHPVAKTSTDEPDLPVDGGVSGYPTGFVASTPKAPGMKYTHYAPSAPLRLIDCGCARVYLAGDNVSTESKPISSQGVDSGTVKAAKELFNTYARLYKTDPAVLSVGILGTQSTLKAFADLRDSSSNVEYPNIQMVNCGSSRGDLLGVARELYAALRKFDELGVDLIISETFPNYGMGASIMNRLEKASS